MFNFVQNWFAPSSRPIGVDFGTDCLRMAQVQFQDGQPRLIAAASTDVPEKLRDDLDGRAKFFVGAARDLLSAGDFRGRQIVLGLPAALTSVASVTLAPSERINARQAIAKAVNEKLGIEPDDALIRDFAVTEPDAIETPDAQIIAIVASRNNVNRLIAAAAEARLEIVGMNVEPKSVIDCFAHVYRRRSDITSTTCFVDIGCSGTRLVVARGGKILAVGAIAIGGADFSRAVASAMSVSLAEARLERLKVCHADTQLDEHRDKRELYAVRPNSESVNVEHQREVIDGACGELLHTVIRQLEQFCTLVALQFPSSVVDRLVFVGGEAQNRRLCRTIARGVGISAVIGDPLVRMGRISDLGFESGIDRREPQPAWTVAIGLSLGAAPPAKREDDRRGQAPDHLPHLVNRAETLR
jgi:Tfp pilus assembly PilM family ATPase